MSYQQQLNDAAKRCHVGSYAVGANRICAEADATIAAKDAEIASLRDRLRDTAQILIAEVGATGPADAEEVARKAVSQIARLTDANRHQDKIIGEQATQIARLREAMAIIAHPVNIGKLYHMDAVTQARAALAQVTEVGK